MTRRRILLLGGALLLGFGVLLRSARPGRTIFVGGPILTMNADDRIVEALVVEGDRIVALGSRAEVERWRTPRARVVELAGRAVVPGFIDAHGHFPGEGLYGVNVDLRSPPVGAVRGMDDLRDRLGAAAARTPVGEWLVGVGYDDTLMQEGRHPTRDDLDQVSTAHPIVTWHISLHVAAVNSAGLARLGIDGASADPVGGRIRRRDGTGDPTGVLEETATEIVTAHGPQIGLRDGVRLVRDASRRYLAAGVTTAQNGLVLPQHMTSLRWGSRLGLVPLRLLLWPGSEVADALLATDEGWPAGAPPWLRVGAVKLIADGSIQGYTGHLRDPYHVPPEDDAAYRGYPRTPRDELHRLVAGYHAAGLQVAVHANGDAAIDDALDAFEAAQDALPRRDARHVVVHAQMARDDQLDRMRRLGVIPTFFALHTYYWGDRHRDVFLGPERANRISPLASAAARGLRFTIHCDSPVVPMEPLRLVWAAVNRRTTSGAILGDTERIEPLRALRAVTIDAAYQHFQEDERGSLEVGKLADLVILSDSPLIDPSGIDQIDVVETFIGGRSLHRHER